MCARSSCSCICSTSLIRGGPVSTSPFHGASWRCLVRVARWRFGWGTVRISFLGSCLALVLVASTPPTSIRRALATMTTSISLSPRSSWRDNAFICADNVVRPGAPEFMWRVCTACSRYETQACCLFTHLSSLSLTLSLRSSSLCLSLLLSPLSSVCFCLSC